MYQLEKLNKNYKIIKTNVYINLLIILIVIISITFYIKYNFNKSNIETWTNTKKYNIAIMTIFKNEQDYMEEWLDHHINQGIEHIFMYCNDPNITNYSYLLNHYMFQFHLKGSKFQ